jgi:hypothetical protein
VIKARKSVGKSLHLRDLNLAANLSVKSNANIPIIWLLIEALGSTYL